MIKELVLWSLIGLGAASLWVVPLIDLLYKLQFTVQHLAMPSKVNEEWMKIHGKDTGTPSLGGVLIWLTVPALLLLGFYAVPFIRAIALILLIVGAYGFLDGILDVVTKKNVKFREFQNGFEWRVGKLVVSILVNIAVALLIVQTAGITEFSLFSWTIHLSSWLGILFVAVCSAIFSYSTEIIDGIDGLSSGMYIITAIGFAFLMLAFPAAFVTSSSTTAMLVIGALLGVLVVYLYFNIPPARFYMGGPGAMPMGPVFMALALYGNVVPAFLVLMLPYLVDLASSTMQIFSMRFLKRKIFKIAPLHHHFEALGWPSPKVVMRFWLANMVVVLLALAVQLFAV